DPSYKGQRGYNRFLLAIYDPWVIGFMTRAVWKVPVPPAVERYRRLIGRRHMDVGPGTGYFLEKAAPPDGTEITLLDPNPNVLRKTSHRLAGMHPTTVEADVMKPLPVEGQFDSAALSFVLHCLRDPMTNKASAIRNIADVLTPDGVLFGGTVLGPAASHTRPARAFLWAANNQGGFDNLDDTVDGLHEILGASFRDVEVEVVGSAALFSAATPTTSA
ncbi:MAG: class I SAM-dependent methyltransferase, partial [Actinomycetota bacterium]